MQLLGGMTSAWRGELPAPAPLPIIGSVSRDFVPGASWLSESREVVERTGGPLDGSLPPATLATPSDRRRLDLDP